MPVRDSAGDIAGPLAALALMRYGIRNVFWAAAVPGGLAALVAIFGIRETKNPKLSQRPGEAGNSGLDARSEEHRSGIQ